QRRLGNGEVRHLIDRHVRAVGRHENPVEHAEVRTARAERLEALLQGDDGVVHLLLDVLELLPHASAPAETSEPMSSPVTTRWMLPLTVRLKPLIGIPFSMQSATAAASMTWRPASSAWR